MSHNILITGASGYLGGTILARWERAKLPPYQTLYALVRTKEQGEAVKNMALNLSPSTLKMKLA